MPEQTDNEPLKVPLIEDVPTNCVECGAPLCLRKQVLNLSLAITQMMKCLICLARDEDTTPQALLDSGVGYIMSRDCFRKEWQRYKDRSDCRDPVQCQSEPCFTSSS